METTKEFTIKTALFYSLLILVLQLGFGIIMGMGWGVSIASSNPDINPAEVSNLIESSISFNVLSMILGEMLILLCGFRIWKKYKTILSDSYAFNRISPLYVIILVVFSITYIVPSSELENIMASVIGRFSSLNKVLIHITQIPGFIGLAVAILTVAIIPSIVEEILFRGLMQHNLVPKYGNSKAIITTSILFALIHFNPSAIVPIFILSLVLGYVYYKTNNLLYSIIIHFSTNILSVFLLRYNSFGISGLNPSNAGIEHVNLSILVPFTLISILAIYLFNKCQLKSMVSDAALNPHGQV